MSDLVALSGLTNAVSKSFRMGLQAIIHIPWV